MPVEPFTFGCDEPPPGVADNDELRRVIDLPRRQWADGDHDWLSDALATPGGTQQLRPIQAAALVELGTEGGLFAPVRVGGGKTLISLLAPVVSFAARPLLLVPAALIGKTRHDEAAYRADWQLGPWIKIMSYELLGRAQAADTLTEWQPDLIIADEAHRLKNPRAACTRRVRRYMREHPETKFVAMSGTITKRSILDYAHILHWCIQPGAAPLPRGYNDLELWADALDERKGQLRRADPGALKRLCDVPELELWDAGEQRRAARLAFRRRLQDTPAIICSDETPIDASITISDLNPRQDLPEIDAAFRTLRSTWETPDGWPIVDGLAMFRHARELALGFYYVWDPRPPREWLEARKEWAAYAREILRHSQTLDSELQVREAYADSPECRAWVAIRDSFEPNTVPVWLTDDVIDVCAKWMDRTGRGIVWTEHTCFAERLSQLTRTPYHGRQGLDANGRAIEQASRTLPLIASIASNGTGRNLQAWNRNLITSMPANGLQTEQLIGRTHRDGQEADTVSFEILTTCAEHLGAFWQAHRDCHYVADSTGAPQKLLLADLTIASASDVAQRSGPRWDKWI